MFPFHDQIDFFENLTKDIYTINLTILKPALLNKEQNMQLKGVSLSTKLLHPNYISISSQDFEYFLHQTLSLRDVIINPNTLTYRECEIFLNSCQLLLHHPTRSINQKCAIQSFNPKHDLD